MNNEITKEQIIEIAARYGIEVLSGKEPGLYIGERKVDERELFADVYSKLNTEDRLSLSLNVTLTKKKHKKNVNYINTFSYDERGIA